MSIADNVTRIITTKSRLPVVHTALLGQKSQQTSEYSVTDLVENEFENEVEVTTCKCFCRIKKSKTKNYLIEKDQDKTPRSMCCCQCSIM